MFAMLPVSFSVILSMLRVVFIKLSVPKMMVI